MGDIVNEPMKLFEMGKGIGLREFFKLYRAHAYSVKSCREMIEITLDMMNFHEMFSEGWWRIQDIHRQNKIDLAKSERNFKNFKLAARMLVGQMRKMRTINCQKKIHIEI